VGITDKDSIAALAHEDVQKRIRLAAIDAPEGSRAFGQPSKLKPSRLL